jgi:hypothetical protein
MNITQLRKSLVGVNLSALSRAAHINVRTLRRIRGGQSSAMIETVHAIQKALEKMGRSNG